jgi:chemotaxis protein methyltransferase CheR
MGMWASSSTCKPCSPGVKMSSGLMDTPELRPAEFELLRDLAEKSFGLDLRTGKERLVAVRLGKHLRAGGFQTFRQYYDRVRSDRSGAMLLNLIDSLTTNHTGFLREPAHFDFLRELLKGEYARRSRVDIWCAASSTGEEPYTLVCTGLTAVNGVAGPDVRVLASDISTRVLGAAKRGVFTEERTAALPREWVTRFFERAPDTPGCFKVKAEVSARTTFQRINLIEPLPPIGPFPIIFCRNVMIYFNKATQADVVARLTSKLEPGGYLFVGHSESLSGISHALRYVRPAVYRTGK